MEKFKMAEFSFLMDLDKVFPKGIEDENLALNMIQAGQKVMQKSIKSAASKHRRTGNLVNSVKCSKPVINSKGDAVGRVKFYGKDKNNMPNWCKGLWIEYGTVHQKAEPFVRPAIKSCESAVKAAMQKAFDQVAKK